MILVDTGFLLALAQPTDALHTRSANWAHKITESLLVSEYVIWETLNALSKRADRIRGQRVVEMLRRDSRYIVVSASGEIFAAGFEMFCTRSDKDWSLTDCISFHIMTQRAIVHALAYDEHFAQAGFVPLLRSDPD